jgi:aminoglycoside N3'-acetyltransferase
MGALPTAFSKINEVRKSIHPTKSVAVWGKDRDYIISEHHTSPMPYGQKSPYYKICELGDNSKIIGIGVTSDCLSCMHCGVDINEDYPIQPYYPELLEGKVIDYDGKEVIVKTYAHDLKLTNHENVPRFLKTTRCPTYQKYNIKKRPFFVVEAKHLFVHITEQAKLGNTFFYPKNLNYKQPKRNQYDLEK